MERSLNEKEIQTVINLGALGYSDEMCKKVLDDGVFDHADFSGLYEKGRARCDYVIDLKLFELSQQGDLKALQKFEARKRLMSKSK